MDTLSNIGTNDMLSKAISIATIAHSGQVDKADKPYILHPLRVMLALENEDAQIVAVMHDVLEDTNITKSDLYSYGFPKHIIDALVCLCKTDSEDYFDYINRVVKNPLALTVKIADMTDNMDLSRIKNPTESDFLRYEKYKKAFKILSSHYSKIK